MREREYNHLNWPNHPDKVVEHSRHSNFSKLIVLDFCKRAQQPTIKLHIQALCHVSSSDPDFFPLSFHCNSRVYHACLKE